MTAHSIGPHCSDYHFAFLFYFEVVLCFWLMFIQFLTISFKPLILLHFWQFFLNGLKNPSITEGQNKTPTKDILKSVSLELTVCYSGIYFLILSWTYLGFSQEANCSLLTVWIFLPCYTPFLIVLCFIT